MSRALLVPVFAFLLAGQPLVVVAADDAPAPIVANLKSNSMIRLGPSKTSDVVVMLKAGAPVEVFGLSKSSPDWYLVRFPKEGALWIDTKSLAAIDDGARYKVIKDKTRARKDSRHTAEVVAELNIGEVVEDKGEINGSWRKVYVPDAVAYVHKSLVDMPKDFDSKLAAAADKAAVAAQTWDQAVRIYTNYQEQSSRNAKAAVGLDWAGLVLQLDVVIADHGSASVRKTAQRIRDSVAALVPAAQDVAKNANIMPPASLPKQPEPTPVQTTPATGLAPTDAGATADPQPLSAAAVAAMQRAQPKPSPWQAEGLLVVDDQFLAKVGTRDVLVDGDGNVTAFIKTKDGTDLKLSELKDRYVGANGELLTVPPEQSGLSKPTKLIIASDVSPVRQ